MKYFGGWGVSLGIQIFLNFFLNMLSYWRASRFLVIHVSCGSIQNFNCGLLFHDLYWVPHQQKLLFLPINQIIECAWHVQSKHGSTIKFSSTQIGVDSERCEIFSKMLSRLFPWNGHSRAIQMDSQSGLDIDNSKRRQIFFSTSKLTPSTNMFQSSDKSESAEVGGVHSFQLP